MVQYYQLPGLGKVGSHHLAIGVLSSLFAGGYLLAGGKKTPASSSPPFNASNKDEENFIQEFLKNADNESAKAGAKH